MPTIGILGEKTLHRELKWYIEPRSACHETPVGRYIADIMADGRITEIQTRDMYRMRAKLAAFLAEYPVTLVYPVAREKWIVTAGGSSGERRRRSPKHGGFCDALAELYGIKAHLTSPNLNIRIMLVHTTEYRAPGRNRRGYVKVDACLDAVMEELTLSCGRDYGRLIPGTLGDTFTTRDFAGAAGLHQREAILALNVLCHVGAVTRVGKSGRLYLYSRTESHE